jgi:hypothetical protein
MSTVDDRTEEEVGCGLTGGPPLGQQHGDLQLPGVRREVDLL